MGKKGVLEKVYQDCWHHANTVMGAEKNNMGGGGSERGVLKKGFRI